VAKSIFNLILLAIVLYLPAPECVAQKKENHVQKQQEPYTLSLDLEFSRKSGNALEGTLSVLFGANPNAYATGFLVGDRLVMTAYHVISGDLSSAKKLNLGFKPEDQLAVKVYVNGCRATVIKVDRDSDLALLEICGSSKSKALTFQQSTSKNEKLFIIARPLGKKMVSSGVFYGPYILRGQEYLSAKIDSRDGYSGSPVYNQKAEIVGVFTGYDRVLDVALISPAVKAKKLIEEYTAGLKP
jgi:S1-C subfamily serine protease